MLEKLLGWKIDAPEEQNGKRMCYVYRADDVFKPEIDWIVKATFTSFTDAIEYLLKKVREEEKQGILPQW